MILARPGLALLLLALASPASAQAKVRVASGEVVARNAPSEARLATRIPGVDSAMAAAVRVSGDSAQRIAMSDYGWRGHVLSVEIDEDDDRVFWDVKIVPDSGVDDVVRYRIDAGSGGILDVHEFTGIHIRIRKP